MCTQYLFLPKVHQGFNSENVFNLKQLFQIPLGNFFETLCPFKIFGILKLKKIAVKIILVCNFKHLDLFFYIYIFKSYFDTNPLIKEK